MSAIAFTGHRPHHFDFTTEDDLRCLRIKASMLDLLERGYHKAGIRHVYVGAALGVDMWAAEAAISLHASHNDLTLHCIIPFASHDQRWSQADRYRISIIYQQADVVTLSPVYYSAAYLNRNQYLVDHADYLAAVYLGKTASKTGTAQTIRYAVIKNKPVICIDPITGRQYVKK